MNKIEDLKLDVLLKENEFLKALNTLQATHRKDSIELCHKLLNSKPVPGHCRVKIKTYLNSLGVNS